MKAVKKKTKVTVEDAPEADEEAPTGSSKVLDLMPLLEKSIRERGHKKKAK
jgi:non-homologous end joining protein Ku